MTPYTAGHHGAHRGPIDWLPFGGLGGDSASIKGHRDCMPTQGLPCTMHMLSPPAPVGAVDLRCVERSLLPHISHMRAVCVTRVQIILQDVRASRVTHAHGVRKAATEIRRRQFPAEQCLYSTRQTCQARVKSINIKYDRNVNAALLPQNHLTFACIRIIDVLSNVYTIQPALETQPVSLDIRLYWSNLRSMGKSWNSTEYCLDH